MRREVTSDDDRADRSTNIAREPAKPYSRKQICEYIQLIIHETAKKPPRRECSHYENTDPDWIELSDPAVRIRSNLTVSGLYFAFL